MSYDPQKNYTWLPDDKIEITGSQFGMILNTFRSILASPLASMMRNLELANTAVEEIMAKQVENGVIKEIQPKQQNVENNEKV